MTHHLDLSTYDLNPGEFEDRLVWARSNGQVSWLWPDIPFERWRTARESVTSAAADVLRHGSAETKLDGDADTLSLAAYTAGLGPLLGWWIAEGRIHASSEVAATMDLHLRHNRMRMDKMRERAIGVARALSQRAIAVTVLKGMHTAFDYFPAPATRPLGDIDLMVDARDTPRAKTYFQASGHRLTYSSIREDSWRPKESAAAPRSIMLVHADDPWTIDLHHSLEYAPDPVAQPTKFDLVTQDCERESWSCVHAASVLPQPLLLLHLAAHAGSSLGSLSPLRMAETVMVIRRDTASGMLRWPAFLEMAKATRALGMVFPALYFAEQLVPGTIPNDVLEMSAEATPAPVRRNVQRWSPAHIQQIGRSSIREHFMWCEDWRGIARRVLFDIAPVTSPGILWSVYRSRAIQVLRNRLRY